MITFEKALEELKKGNERYVNEKYSVKKLDKERREDLVNNGQHPFAIIVTCSDSRVPPEYIFDQALGDLFVIRAAGNVVDDIGVGSIEYAAEHLHSPLVVVMGHEKCGAVQATVQGGEVPGSIGSIIAKIKPSVDKVKSSCCQCEDVCEKVVDENVRTVVEEVKKSAVIKHLMEHGEVKVIGARYNLSSGEVIWL